MILVVGIVGIQFYRYEAAAAAAAAAGSSSGGGIKYFPISEVTLGKFSDVRAFNLHHAGLFAVSKASDVTINLFLFGLIPWDILPAGAGSSKSKILEF